MPELPEVERGRKLAASVADGRTISRVKCTRDDIVYQGMGPTPFRRKLEGKRVVAVRRRGKQLWFEMERAPHPLFHFGMSGAFHTPGAEALPLMAGPKKGLNDWPPRFVKIHIEMHDGGLLAMTDARRLGRILLRDDPMREPPISRLGFDPLLDLPGPKSFARRLRARGAVIKSLLLDQSFAAGVGNWIADEVLYQARIDPTRHADSLSLEEALRVRRKLKLIIDRAVAVNADNARYPQSWLFHRRWGKQAEAFTSRGEAIEHITVGGRTTAWVPSVQS